MITKIRKILFATDLTVKSMDIFPLAVNIAREQNATIVILHTIEPLPNIVVAHSDRKSEQEYYKVLGKSSEERIRARIENECLKLEQLNKLPCSSLVSKVLTPAGNAVEEILSSADEEQCDLIVMGTRGKDSLKDAFLGSVAQLVLQKTKKPVLVVPLPADQESVLQGKTILVVDDEPDVLEVLKAEILDAAPDCNVTTSKSHEDAATLLTSHSYDLAIFDIMGVGGFDLLRIATERPRPIPVVLLTAHAHSVESLKRAIQMGARAYLPKEKLGDIVRHLEDVMTYEYGPAWKRLLREVGGYLHKTWGPYWRQPDEEFWKEFDRKIDSAK